jgi:hypothetical protein
MNLRSFVSIAVLGAASVLGVTSANAKVFYVAQSSNRTTGGITGCGDALSVAWFNNASSWGTASHQISAGTTVYLCGTFRGTPGEQLLMVGGSGAAGEPITIKFMPYAVLTAPYWSGMGAIDIDYRSHIVIDGGTNGIIENTANGTGRAYHQNSVAIHAYKCTSCTVQNLTIQNLYVRTSISDLAPSASINCVYWHLANYMTVNHITCHDAAWAIPGDGNNFTLENSDIYHVDHGVASGAVGVASNYSIHNNHFHDFANWDSTVNKYHHDGIHFWGQNGGRISGGAIYNNTFDGDFGVNVTGHIFLQDSVQHVAVYNNVFVAPTTRTINSLWFYAASTSLPGGPATGNSAYNNSISSGGQRSGASLAATNQFLFTAVNNVLAGGSADISIQGGGSRSSTGINNNLYRDLFAEFGDRNTFGLVGHTYFTLSTWRGACHCDGSSKLVTSAQTTSFSSVTLTGGAETVSASDAVNTSVTSTDATADPTLQELATIGVGNGLNLSDIATGELAGLALDKNGAPRPTSGPWNVGPF